MPTADLPKSDTPVTDLAQGLTISGLRGRRGAGRLIGIVPVHEQDVLFSHRSDDLVQWREQFIGEDVGSDV
jgi:hypothetical protein